jgi:RNA polymerase sigma-70 factor (ECF subfamily)
VWFRGIAFAYCEGVRITPEQSAEGTSGEGVPWQQGMINGALLEELWQKSDAGSCGLERTEFSRILHEVGAAQNFGLDEGEVASREEQMVYFNRMKLGDLVLARACAAGKESAWKRFVTTYREPLIRAGTAITRSETLGLELADQLYAELFGLTMRDGERRCPLGSYRGRGSLMGWLRTTLAQRHVDHYRRSHREEPLEEFDTPAQEPEPEHPVIELTVLEKAVEGALRVCKAEDRLLLAAYYLDRRTLQQIAQVFHVHEATVSRKLKRACEQIHKQVVKNLHCAGMSRRAAEEALGADPRDLDLNLKRLLQYSQADTFEEKAER